MLRPTLALLAPLLLAIPARAVPKLDVPQVLAEGERILTVVSQNDLHGGLVPAPEDRARQGSYYWFAGYVNAIRRRLATTYGERGRAVLLDAGDAIQGTLLANSTEGAVVIDAMNRIGFDAALAGNHGFDFGPRGWEYDRVIPGKTEADPLGALRAVVQRATFPFLGANVYDKATGERLLELPPYVLLPLFDGRKLAVIGTENPLTHRATIAENVAGLRFTQGVEEIKTLVEELAREAAADVFILLTHQGDGSRDELAEFLRRLPRRSTGEPLVDLAIGGHTHQVNNSEAGGIPYLQSGANGRMFGYSELVLVKDPASGRFKVDRERTRTKAGTLIQRLPEHFLGEKVMPDPGVADLLVQGRKQVEAMAREVLATSTGRFERDGNRTSDFPLGNLLADLMREAAGTEVAIMNGGGLRDDFPEGPLDYEALFRVLPSNQLLVTMPALPVSLLAKNLEKAVQSCGCRGALQISGITIEFFRDCRRESAKARSEDRRARILRLTTDSGRVIYERRGQEVWIDPRPISVATADFVVGGGSGYPGFPPTVLAPDPVPLRDAVAAVMRRRALLRPSEFGEGRYRPRPIPPELVKPEPKRKTSRRKRRPAADE